MKKLKLKIDKIFDEVQDEKIILPQSTIDMIADLPPKKTKKEFKTMETKTQKAGSGRRILAVALSGVFAIAMTFGILAIAGVFKPGSNDINPTAITLNISPFELREDKAALEAKVEPGNATDKSITWSSSDTSIVTVSDKGAISIVGTGNATITAKTCNNLTENCSITIDNDGNVEMEILNSTFEDDLINIGIISGNPKETVYSVASFQDFNETFTFANGYRISIAVYNLKQSVQIEALNRFIEMDIDYVLLSPVAEIGWDSSMAMAETAGIPVLLFNYLIDSDKYTAAVTLDYFGQSEKAIDWLLGEDLDEINVLHLQGMFGSETQIGRSSALEVADAEGKLNIVKQETGNWYGDQAKQIVQDAIIEGLSFNVIYAENDEMALGAVQALNEAGISHGVGGDVIVISFNAHKWALAEVLKGNWNYNVQCSPFHASYIHEIIQKLENGVEITEKIIYAEDIGFDARTITQADVNKYGL